MALQKTVQVVKVATPAADARYSFYLADANAPHPNCLMVDVHLADGDVCSLYLQHVTRDENGVVTGKVSTGVLTGPQMLSLKNACEAIHAQAAIVAGYTNVP